MEKCKFCLAEIEEGLTTCPCCGKDLMDTEAPEAAVTAAQAQEVSEEPSQEQEVPAAQPQEEAPKKSSPVKTAVGIAVIVVLVAVIVALIMVIVQGRSQDAAPETIQATEEAPAYTVPADGEPGTAREKGSYTVSDEEMLSAKDIVVATMGDKTLTNGQLQVYYWMGYHNFITSNYSYAQYFGLDMTQPLDTQIMNAALHGEDYSQTWQQYFLQFGLNSWQQVQAVALAAEEAGLEMEQEDQDRLDNLEANLEDAIAAYDVSMEEYLAMNFGSGAGLEEYRHYQEVYYRGAPYYAEETMKMIPTDEEMDQYFADHEEEYTNGGVTKDSVLVDVRHILLQPENAQEDGTFSDEDWAACEKKARELLNEYRAGEKTEEAFAALANEHSTDPGSNTNGGLYMDVYEGQMVTEFNDWCFNAARKHGDTELVKTSYGYHVMYFVERHEDVWKDYVKNDWISEKSNAMLESVIAEYPMEVSYDKIVLGKLMEQK